MRRTRADASAEREDILDIPKKMPEVLKGNEQPGETNREKLEDGGTMKEDWRELVRQIQEEKDTHKLMSLVQELIGKFDEEKSRKNLQRPSGAA